jgi:hypothetical protein
MAFVTANYPADFFGVAGFSRGLSKMFWGWMIKISPTVRAIFTKLPNLRRNLVTSILFKEVAPWHVI